MSVKYQMLAVALCLTTSAVLAQPSKQTAQQDQCYDALGKFRDKTDAGVVCIGKSKAVLVEKFGEPDRVYRLLHTGPLRYEYRNRYIAADVSFEKDDKTVQRIEIAWLGCDAGYKINSLDVRLLWENAVSISKTKKSPNEPTLMYSEGLNKSFILNPQPFRSRYRFNLPRFPLAIKGKLNNGIAVIVYGTFREAPLIGEVKFNTEIDRRDVFNLRKNPNFSWDDSSSEVTKIIYCTQASLPAGDSSSNSVKEVPAKNFERK